MASTRTDTAYGAASVDRTLRSALRGPLLGLLLEQDRPVSAYRLSSLLIQRLPAWQITHSAVANLLKRLVEEGYVSLSGDVGHGYGATDTARLALEDWMRRPLSRSGVREELHARVASASPRHARLLYAALETYERECFEMLDQRAGASSRSVAPRSWRSLTISITNVAAEETLQGNIRWSKIAKHWLRDWLAAGDHRIDELPPNEHVGMEARPAGPVPNAA